MFFTFSTLIIWARVYLTCDEALNNGNVTYICETSFRHNDVYIISFGRLAISRYLNILISHAWNTSSKRYFCVPKE